MANATKKPSGLTIKRNGALKFALTWKIGDSNYSGGHQLRWRVWKTESTYTAWTDVTPAAAATSTTITVTASNYYPNTGKPKAWAFEYEVRGKRGTETSGGVTTTYEWSDWASYKHRLRVPNKPTVTATLNTATKTTFAYTSEKADDDWRPFTKYVYETILVENCTEVNGAKLKWSTTAAGWATASPTSAGSVEKTESNTANKTLTRWFRIKGVGPAGDSDWAYAKHVYAKPHRPKITKVKSSKRSGNTSVTVTWVLAKNAAYPVDDVSVQYALVTPATGMTVPTGTTWTEAVITSDTSGDDDINFVISNAAGTDQVLFTRVVSRHDASINTTNINPSDPVIADYGTLATPTNLSVTVNSSHVATSISVNNASSVSDSKVAIVCRDKSGKDTIIGVTASGSGTKTLSNKQCPASASKRFYAYAFQGDSSSKTRSDGVSAYTVDANMTSAKSWDTATTVNIPQEPSGFTATKKSDTVAKLSWDVNWSNAAGTIISWSSYKYAWTSTNEPSTYRINDKKTESWRVAGLEPGHIWYFRARFFGTVDDEEILGPWSDIVELDYTAAPETPVLTLSKGVVEPNGKLKASWTYSSEDGTKQAAAEVRIATTVSGGVVTAVGNQVLKKKTGKSGTIDTTGWTSGQTYNLTCRVTSNTGKDSDWSNPVPFYIGPPLTCTISSMTNIASTTVTDAGSNTRTAVVMSALPATVTVTGAGAGGTTTLLITRAEDYPIERPDGSIRDGYSGETVFLHRQTGEAAISIDRSLELIGALDDGAQYRLTAIVEDGNGQKDDAHLDFEIHWGYQPSAPTPTVSFSNGAAVLRATASTQTGDTLDIYRLSADLPQLIVKGGSFSTYYVDPYPTIGQNGGYRFVFVSKYGDYITSAGKFAWTDVATNLESQTGWIHFNGEAIPVDFNVQVSSSWSKDFKETKYLGGSVRGDWNPATSRSTSVKMVVPSTDTATIQQLRRLADYPGICHVRTQDGSSFAADVQVSGDAGYDVGGNLETYTLKITRVDPQELDGVLQSRY